MLLWKSSIVLLHSIFMLFVSLCCPLGERERRREREGERERERERERVTETEREDKKEREREICKIREKTGSFGLVVR